MRPAEVAPGEPFVCLPLCCEPNAFRNTDRGRLTRWNHFDLRAKGCDEIMDPGIVLSSNHSPRLEAIFRQFRGSGTAAAGTALVAIVLAEGDAMNLTAHETSEQLSRALGEAVVKNWGRLPNDVQRFLFEQAVNSHGERMRPQLAAFLHVTHPRTCAAVEAQAIPEPDSLGG